MTVMYEAKVLWAGFPGAPGVNTLYATTTDPLQAGLDAFATGVKSLITGWVGVMPAGVTVQLQTEMNLIEDVDGSLVNIMNVTTPDTPHNGALGGIYSGPSGMAITWLTAAVLFGKRRQGRTFVVPISTEAYQTDGTLASASLSAQRGFATTYATATAFHPVVWSRPIEADPEATPPVAARAGGSAPVVAARITDKAAVLRSRRD